jgi:hypothetical protein
MFEPGDDDLVAFPHITAAPGLGHEIDGFSRAARENNVVEGSRAKEAADFFTCCLIGVGRARSKRMGATVDIRVLILIVQREPVDDRLGLLRGRRIIKPD